MRVGVLAVDPSSPFSGGALLGDRVRMQEHATDPEVFIRSMASRGHLGGLAWATPQALRVLDAAGCDVVLVETVGRRAVRGRGRRRWPTPRVVLLAPGMGDGIQAAKAGILEIGDVFVVNKADRDGADTTVRELRHMLSLGRAAAGRRLEAADREDRRLPRRGRWPSSLDALDRHLEWLRASGHLHGRRLRRAAEEIEAIAVADLRQRMGSLSDGQHLQELAAQVVAGALDAFSAADTLVAGLVDRPR